jgi:hypothetical protein
VITLLVDANLDGHGELVAMRLGTEAWREFRDYLEIRFLYFEQVGLARNEKDDVVWRLCQRNGYYLLTANRNLESDDSLEATIRREGTNESLPVFTFSDAEGIYQSPTYLDDVIQSLLDYLLNEANYRGTGRLYLP